MKERIRNRRRTQHREHDDTPLAAIGTGMIWWMVKQSLRCPEKGPLFSDEVVWEEDQAVVRDTVTFWP